MKYFSGLLFLAIMAYLISPYYSLYEINNAIEKNDNVTFEKWVDIEEVRQIHKENMEWKINNVGPQGGIFADTMRKGINAFGNVATDTIIDANWMLERLRKIKGPLWEELTFAFFESPTRFTVRLGQLGREPLHIQLTRQDWFWRVTAIYE
ncbi:MAG: DUF2939 domain-containing protein [Thiomargarita sp.]|jgi:hypothetical protein|nr:DUF2939 domain-containing protein [Thiomargarita sp.]